MKKVLLYTLHRKHIGMRLSKYMFDSDLLSLQFLKEKEKILALLTILSTSLVIHMDLVVHCCVLENILYRDCCMPRGTSEYTVCKVKFDMVCVTIVSVYLEQSTSMSLSDVNHIIHKLSTPIIL